MPSYLLDSLMPPVDIAAVERGQLRMAKQLSTNWNGERIYNWYQPIANATMKTAK